MGKQVFDESVSDTPTPSSATPIDGMEQARTLARRYLPDGVRFLAALAFGKDTEASLHSRFLAANLLATIAGVIPQATPTAPQIDSAGDGSARRD
jgi:hypothetical protein